MTIVSVKIYSSQKEEVLSTVTLPNEDISNLSSILKQAPLSLIIDSNIHDIQGLLLNQYLFVHTKTSSKFTIVAIATLNTSFFEIETFLTLLKQELSSFNPKSLLEDNEAFQIVCEQIIQRMESQNEISIALLGLDKAGKTTFLNILKDQQSLTGFKEYLPTKSLNIDTIHLKNIPYRIKLFDLGMAFQSHWWMFAGECEGFIFFIDAADISRRNEAMELFNEIRNFWDCPYVIAANKVDICKIHNIRKYLARKLKVSIRKVYETNTSTGEGVESLLEGLITTEINNKSISISLVTPNHKKR
ncbi:ADP-ribosylation factor-like protein [Candidatus Hodarchaeum mangrovi]